MTLALSDGALRSVHYTLDGSLPGTRAESFTGTTSVELTGTGNRVIACRVVDGSGQRSYEAFHYTIGG